MDLNFTLRPPYVDPNEPKSTILDRMVIAAKAYEGKAGPSNQPFIVDKLKQAGFPMDQITDWLPHLMYHLGAPEDVL